MPNAVAGSGRKISEGSHLKKPFPQNIIGGDLALLIKHSRLGAGVTVKASTLSLHHVLPVRAHKLVQSYFDLIELTHLAAGFNVKPPPAFGHHALFGHHRSGPIPSRLQSGGILFVTYDETSFRALVFSLLLKGRRKKQTEKHP